MRAALQRVTALLARLQRFAAMQRAKDRTLLGPVPLRNAQQPNPGVPVQYLRRTPSAAPVHYASRRASKPAEARAKPLRETQ